MWNKPLVTGVYCYIINFLADTPQNMHLELYQVDKNIYVQFNRR